MVAPTAATPSPEIRSIRTGADFSESFSEAPDVCIVGSGAGGAPAALALAQAGLDVLVLEGGGYFRTEDFNQRERDMVPAFHANRGSRFTADGAIALLGAEMIGGTTVINTADCVTIPEPVLEKWAAEHGVTGLDAADLAPAVDWVHEVLGAHRIADEDINTNNRLLMDGSRALGYAGHPFVNSRVKCVGCGYCLLACAYEAKQSALVTWVPRAAAAGARFYANCRVTKIHAEGRRVTSVEGHVIDPETREPKFPFRVTPKTLVLSAGTFNTAALLLASGVANSSGQVGRNLILQPQMPILATFKKAVRAFRGIPQAYAVSQFHEVNRQRGDWGYWLEGIFAQAGTIGALLSGFGTAHQELMRRYAHMAMCLVLAPDEPGGVVDVEDDGRPRVTYTLQDSWRDRATQGAREAIKIYLEAGAEQACLLSEPMICCTTAADTELVTRDAIDAGRVPIFSAHPQGTCRMGADPATSVVDSTLQTHDVENLYVMDGSVFPSTASSHTQVPIMSVSWLSAQRLATRLTGRAPAVGVEA